MNLKIYLLIFSLLSTFGSFSFASDCSDALKPTKKAVKPTNDIVKSKKDTPKSEEDILKSVDKIIKKNVKLLKEPNDYRRTGLPKNDYQEKDLSGANISKLDLSGGRNFEKTNFSEIHAKETIFNDANLRKTNFKKAFIAGASFVDADLRYADFSNTSFDGVDVEGADFSHAIFYGADLTNIINADKAKWEDARINQHTKFSSTFFGFKGFSPKQHGMINDFSFTAKRVQKQLNQSNRNLDIANLSWGVYQGKWRRDNSHRPHNFTNASLISVLATNAVFLRAVLENVNAENGIFINTSFQRANMQNANFQNANLENTDFNKADVRGADFTNAHVTSSTWYQAVYDKNTKFPERFNPELHGMKFYEEDVK